MTTAPPCSARRTPTPAMIAGAGDAERRSRFFFEVAEAVRSAVGDDLPVTARLSVEDSVEGGLQRDESLAL